MTKEDKGLSIRAYAAHRKKLGLHGGSPWSVKKALRDGRINKNQHGKINPETADREWEENTNPAQRRDHKKLSEQATARRKEQSTGGGEQPDVPPYSQSRAVKEAYQARLSRLIYEEKKGSLVNVDEVKFEAFRRARMARDQILAVPDRVAPILAAEDDEDRIQEILESELRDALEVLSNV